MLRPTAVIPPSAPTATQLSVAPGRRWAASSPATAPTSVPTKARNRSWRIAGPRSAVVRSTGESSTWRTSERSSGERAAAAARAQAERDRHRGDAAQPRACRARGCRGRPCRDVAVADGPGDGHDGDEADDPGQVGAVERVDPVDVRDALLAPVGPPVREGTLEVGIGVGSNAHRSTLGPPPDGTCSRDGEAMGVMRRGRAPLGKTRRSERLSEPLDDHGHALAAADAHGLEAVAAFGVLEPVEEGGHDAGAGHARRGGRGRWRRR